MNRDDPRFFSYRRQQILDKDCLDEANDTSKKKFVRKLKGKLNERDFRKALSNAKTSEELQNIIMEHGRNG